MLFLLITHDPYLREYRNQRLADRLAARGVRIVPLFPGREEIRVGPDGVQIRTNGGEILHPNLVINGLYRSSGRGLDLVRVMELAGYPVINRAEAWHIAKVKPLASVRLSAFGIPHPVTLFSHGRLRIGTRDFRRTKWVVVKPWRGALGLGVRRFRNRITLNRYLRILHRRNRNALVQKFVPNPGRDIRVVIVGDQDLGATYRVAPPGTWKTNVAAGGFPANCEVTPELRQLAVRATRAIGLDIAGVDIVESPKGLLVFELNAWPNFQIYDRVVGIDVADRIAEYLVSRARR